ncbi:MAG: ABC transporter permease [Hyphomonadaceae bacterium]|nr:ABC transporter permease [Hyphomonadaceae bacterium]
MREIWIIARREYLAYVAAWGFWLSLATAPLLLALFLVAPVLAGNAEPARLLAVLADDPRDRAAVEAAFEGRGADALPRYVIVLPPAPTAAALAPWLTGARTITVDGEERPLFAAVVVRAGALEYWSVNLTDDGPSEIASRAVAARMRAEAMAARGLSAAEAQAVIALKPMVTQFDPRAGEAAAAVTAKDRAPFVAGAILAVVLWSAVMGVANMLLTGVIEEKSNKILDALLTSATPLNILVGKLAGVAGVSFTLFGVWGAVGATALAFAPQDNQAGAMVAAAIDPGLIALFAPLFLGGYLIYGALFLGLGALCDTLQEAQSLLGPVVLMLTMPILLIGPAFQNPQAPLVVAASWFPPFTPFVMMMRAPAGLSPPEMAGALALVAATAVVVMALVARAFHAGVVNQVNAASWRRRLFAGGTGPT